MLNPKTLTAETTRVLFKAMGRATQISGLIFVAACGGGTSSDTASGGVVSAPAAQAPTPTPAPAQSGGSAAAPIAEDTVARNRSTLGVNLTSANYFSGERSFANLLVGSDWVDPHKSWGKFDLTRVDANGYVTSLAAGEQANIILTPPAATMAGSEVTIRCTYAGTGKISLRGTVTGVTGGDHLVDFTWPALPLGQQRVYLELLETSAGDPVRDLDCREKDMPRSQVFADEFVESLKPFGVIRFLDWSGANGRSTFEWTTRQKASALVQVNSKNVAIEHMIALVRKTGASPWFPIPWNADESYVRGFAKMVHDQVPAGTPVYVEMANEVWNYSFPVTTQAQDEGLSSSLSSNAFEATLRRYAQKLTWAMKIWTEVYADRPADLVRVAATQHSNPWTATTVLSYGDTANFVDALATAPYFGHSLFQKNPTAELSTLFQSLATDADAVSALTITNRDIAKKYGKRYIAYEAGQHLINSSNIALLGSLNRDARMYDLYKSYLASWRTNVGDVMVLYNSTGPITSSGAWGLREYAGQPISETPKRRAAVEDASNWIK
jgi:hypothetical protein